MSFFKSKKDLDQRVQFFKTPGSDLRVNYNYWPWDNWFKVIALLTAVIFTFPLIEKEMTTYERKVEEARSLDESNYVIEINVPSYPALMQAIESAKLIAVDSSEMDIDPEIRNLGNVGIRFFKGDQLDWVKAFDWHLYLGMNKLLLYDSERGVIFGLSYRTWIDTLQDNAGVDWTPIETNSGYGLEARVDESYLTFNLVVGIITGAVLFILALIIAYRVLGFIIFAIKRRLDDRYWVDAQTLDDAARSMIHVNSKNRSKPIVVLFGGKYYVSYIDSK